MEIQSLTKVASARAHEVCTLAANAGIKLDAGETQTPVQFLASLVAANKLGEAVQFLAFALPARESVAWACACVRSLATAGEPLAPPMQAALEAAEAWVNDPTDDNRRAAMTKAQATTMDAPAAWAAVAAFWSGGSMAPKDLPSVPPPPHLVGVAVSGAITLAAVQTEPQRADEKRQRFIASGVAIANGNLTQAQRTG